MPRRDYSDQGSLELLLDTITNTFGCVLFISLLTAILVRLQPESVDSVENHPFDAQALTQSASDLQNDIQRTQRLLASLPTPDPNAAALQRKISSTTTAITESAAEETRLLQSIAEMQDQLINEEKRATDVAKKLETTIAVAEEIEDINEQLSEESAKLATDALQIDRPVDPQTIRQNAKLPVIETVDKRQFGLLLKYGRVYVMHEWTTDGVRLGPNAKDFIVTKDAQGNFTAIAKPDAGFIADAQTVRQNLENILAAHPPAEWAIAICTNLDSFSQYQTVKSSLIAMGYQYNPLEYDAIESGIWDTGGAARAQ